MALVFIRLVSIDQAGIGVFNIELFGIIAVGIGLFDIGLVGYHLL